MTKIISIVQNGKRVDIPQEQFQKMLKEAEKKLEKKEQKDEI